MEQIIALDIGESRTGIAKADPEGILVKAYKTIATQELKQTLEELSQTFEINTIVIGLPLNADTSDTEQSLKIKDLVTKLNILDKELVYEDEKHSSDEAKARLSTRGITISKDNKELIDAEAAAVILEQYFTNKA